MGMIIKDNKLIILIDPKTFYFALPKKVDNSIKHEIHFIIKHNKFAGEHTMKNDIN